MRMHRQEGEVRVRTNTTLQVIQGAHTYSYANLGKTTISEVLPHTPKFSSKQPHRPVSRGSRTLRV